MKAALLCLKWFMPWFTLPVTHLLLPLYEKCYITSFREGSPIGVLNHRVQNSTVMRLARICSLWKPTLEGIAALRTTLQSSRGEAWKTRVRPWAKLGKGSALGFHTAPLLVNHFPGRQAKGKATWPAWLKLSPPNTPLLPPFLSCALGTCWVQR